ncbi:MAG: hypothetical protein ABSG15_11340 [FCB group bacterium]|jgi:hypothetical protein
MKKNVLFILLFISSIINLNTGSLYSQDTIKYEKIKYDEFSYKNNNEIQGFSIYYINRSVPPKEGNQMSYSGNNFIGIEMFEIAPISESLAAEWALGFQFGNINGSYSDAFYFSPGIAFGNGASYALSANFSTGLIILSAKNGDWKYGGFGVNPEIEFSIKIYRRFSVMLRFGGELYPNISYFNIGSGLSYRWRD